MLPETCRVVIPIKLEFSASVGFIHKEFTSSVCAGVQNVTVDNSTNFVAAVEYPVAK
jgi:hypothetical protein